MLHLLKNMRRRIRLHGVVRTPGCPEVSASQVDASFGGGMDAFKANGPGPMQDRAGLQAFAPEVALDCLWIGEDEAANYLAPWATLQRAGGAVGVSRVARLEMLEVVYAMFETRFSALRKVRQGKAFGMAERAGSGVPLTFTTRQLLKRGMNLVIGLYYAIEN
jgi:hypothetical protein